jgi:hypothetical protein
VGIPILSFFNLGAYSSRFSLGSCFSPAERVGFEPTVARKGHNGFRDRPDQPLRHLSMGGLYNGQLHTKMIFTLEMIGFYLVVRDFSREILGKSKGERKYLDGLIDSFNLYVVFVHIPFTGILFDVFSNLRQ